MGLSIGGENRGTIAEINVVPLIDVLLVLLVIFMIIPHSQVGLNAAIPQPYDGPPVPRPEVVVVQVLADGTLCINQEPVKWGDLQRRLGVVFELRADRTAFIRGESPVEFGVVAKVIDVMQTAGIASIGLLTPELEKGH